VIELVNVYKFYGMQDVLKDANLKIMPKERVGIVGPNGAGKSTIFRMITGQEETDKGDLLMPKGIRLGHLKQQLNPQDVNQTLIEYAEDSMPELKELQAQIDTLDPSDPKQLEKLGDVQISFESLGGYEMRSRAEGALGGLGFSEADFSKRFAEFSGGWQMRAELTRVLIAEPDVLLLDEPSNYLDLPAVEWLRRYLRGFQGTLLLISHDRYLLKSLADITVEIAGGLVSRYQGDYTYYLEQREARRHQLVSAKKNQDRKKAEMERFIERFKAKNTKASQAQSRMKALEKMEEIDVPPELIQRSWIRVAEPPHCGSEVLALEKISHAYEEGQFILRDIDLTIARGDKIGLVGFNGMGKTTLLRIIAGVLEPSSGRRRLGHQVVVGYQSQAFAETMAPGLTLYGVLEEGAGRLVTEKEVRGTLGSFGFSGDDVKKTVRVLSGGEKIRLAFARLFLNPPNLLILDEPTTHLDIDGRCALEEALTTYPGTVCFVSHDVSFVRATAERIVALHPEGMVQVHGGYDYYLEKASPHAIAVAKKKPAAKDKKAREADRQAAIKAQRKWQRQVKDAEAAIEGLESEQVSLAEQLGVADADYGAINGRLAEIQSELADWNNKWEEAVEALDAE